MGSQPPRTGRNLKGARAGGSAVTPAKRRVDPSGRGKRGGREKIFERGFLPAKAEHFDALARSDAKRRPFLSQ